MPDAMRRQHPSLLDAVSMQGLGSDNPAYVNQAWLDRIGLTLMPVNERLVVYQLR
jgi:hypothetical protein